MTLITRKPKEALTPRHSSMIERWDDVEGMFGRMFDDFWQRPHFGTMADLWPHRPTVSMPVMDVYEEKSDVVIKVEMPGLKKDEVEVSLTDTMLTVRGEKKEHDEVRDRNYYRSERTRGVVSRTIKLPADVNGAKATATFTNGVLELKLPKVAAATRKARKIPIQ